MSRICRAVFVVGGNIRIHRRLDGLLPGIAVPVDIIGIYTEGTAKISAEAEPLSKHHSLVVFELSTGIPQTGSPPGFGAETRLPRTRQTSRQFFRNAEEGWRLIRFEGRVDKARHIGRSFFAGRFWGKGAGNKNCNKKRTPFSVGKDVRFCCNCVMKVEGIRFSKAPLSGQDPAKAPTFRGCLQRCSIRKSGPYRWKVPGSLPSERASPQG